jgi:hypothetical protein
VVVVVLVEPDGGVAVSEGGIGRGEGGGRARDELYDQLLWTRLV